MIFRKYRDALKTVRAPTSSGGGRGNGPVIEMVNASLLHPNRSYTPLSTEDPGNSRSLFSFLFSLCVWLLRKCWKSKGIEDFFNLN